MGLQNLLEDYRNWNRLQDWKLKKQTEEMFGGDFEQAEDFEKWAGGFSPSNLGGGLSGLAGAIKASHGSPHAHTKFDFSKIGTGEGVQAYGHGGYFAQGFDSPVAKEYMIDQRGASASYIANRFLKNWGDKGKALDALDAYITKLTEEVKPEHIIPYQEARSRIASESTDYGPYLYNVELKWPDAAREAADPLGEHHLLDWDAPLSEQPEAFKGLLPSVEGIGKVAAEKVKILSEQPGLADWAKQDLLNDARQLAQSNSPAHVAHLLKTMQLGYGISPSHGPFSNVADDFLDFVKATQAVPNMNTGGGAVSYLEALHGEKGASDVLRKAGIPGIRYLDQGSRGAGEGTRNYVMFDDRFPNIVSRNGVSLADLLRK